MKSRLNTERSSERGSTRNINKNTCEEEPNVNENTGQNNETFKCFLTVAMTKLGRFCALMLEKRLKTNWRARKP